MRFHQLSRKRRGKLPKIAAVIVVILVLLVLIQPAFLSKMVLSLSKPFSGARSSMTANSGTFFGAFKEKQELVEENKKLQEEIEKLKIKSDLYDQTRNTTAFLEGGTTTYGIISQVLSTPPFSPYDTMILASGADAGVTKGDSVLFDDTVSVGVIDEVTDHASRVILNSSPGEEQSVRVGQNDFLVTAHGLGGGSFELSVPKETDIEKGDGVYASNGLLVAIVKNIIIDESDAFLTVRAVLPFNLFETREVNIIQSRALSQ